MDEVKLSAGKDAPDEDPLDCNEPDAVVPEGVLVWAGTVSTPSEVKETTVASEA